MFVESNTRSIAKALSWRLSGAAATVLIVLVATGHIHLSLMVGGVEFIAKIFLYYCHERIWNQLQYGRRIVKPSVIWLTGLSGSGKTTLALELVQEFRRRGLRCEHLDGDSLRDILPGTGFSREERVAHAKRVGVLASILERNGISVVVSLISPYAESRDFVRKLCKNFVELYVSTPLEVCENRDPKGLYKKARLGEIQNFTGLNDPYEAPVNPEISIDTSRLNLAAARERVFSELRSQSFV